MVTGRAGHSLPELIVAVSFLGATLAAVGGSAVLGARWATRAVVLQAAVRTGAAALDSLVAVPEAASGSSEGGAIETRWTVAGDRIDVVVRGPDGEVLVRIGGRRPPPVPVLPDVGSDAVEARP